MGCMCQDGRVSVGICVLGLGFDFLCLFVCVCFFFFFFHCDILNVVYNRSLSNRSEKKRLHRNNKASRQLTLTPMIRDASLSASGVARVFPGGRLQNEEENEKKIEEK